MNHPFFYVTMLSQTTRVCYHSTAPDHKPERPIPFILLGIPGPLSCCSLDVFGVMTVGSPTWNIIGQLLKAAPIFDPIVLRSMDTLLELFHRPVECLLVS